jgi:microcystin-dependent protein
MLSRKKLFAAAAVAALIGGSVAIAKTIHTKGIGSESLFLIDGTSGNSLELKPGSLSASFSLTMPNADGTNGQVLQTNGSGGLSWASTAGTGVPSGTLITFAGSTCPTGYLPADGSAVSRATYWELLGAISTSWGIGDGSSTFNVPDLRNRFMRGTGTSGDGNGGNAVALASYQGDAFQGHVHKWGGSSNAVGGGTSSLNNNGTRNIDTSTPTTDGVNGTPRTADETRPKSYGVLICIKT